MEKNINRKIAQHANTFKTVITDEIKKLNIDKKTKTDLLRLVFDYNVLTIDKSDITKRKRAKNVVPLQDRCCALRAAGQQCSRRKKEPHDFCGTHIKGTPHGVITDKPPKKTYKELDVWLTEIHGISYYIDANNNVYSHNDIINNITNPAVIAKYVKDAKGNITIPSLFG
jgi:hypothetical protein